jgi:lycopene beta-cyclase
MENYRDVVVIGLGSAALQLARYFHEHPSFSKKRILFLDPQRQPAKSWCFWHAGPHPMDPWVDHQWSQLHVQTKAWAKVEQPGGYTYRHVSSTALYKWFFEDALISSPSWEFKQESVTHIELQGNQQMVYTDSESFLTPQVYDSRLRPEDLHPPLILQHFRGWILEAEEDLFNPHCATFMDFHLSDQEDVPTFVYVLPFSTKRALVETTIFSRKRRDPWHYDEITQRYIKAKWPGVTLTRTGEETGVIPMAFVKDKGPSSGSYQKIGGAAGCIKPTTGYAFSRIHRHLEALMLKKTLRKSVRFSFYDRLLLDIIDNRPKDVPRIFHHLFKNNPLSLILRFLDEDSSLLEEAQIFATLPFGPFLHALGKQWILKK